MATPKFTIEVPETAAPRPHSLTAVASVTAVPDRVAFSGVEYIDDIACGLPGFAPNLCSPDIAALVAPGTEKQFSGIDTTEGDRFGLYAGVECYLGAFTDYEQRAVRTLERGQSFGVEKAAHFTIFEGAEDLGTAVPPVIGLALLEQYAGAHYGGRPTIHLTPWAATVLAHCGVIERYDGELVTKIGSQVIVGSGYDQALTGTTSEMFATGAVHLFHGNITTVSAPAAATNRERALAERVYSLTAECFAASVTIDTDA